MSINFNEAVNPKSEYVSSVFVPLEEVPETRSLFPDFIAETIFESSSGVSAQALSLRVKSENFFFPSIIYFTFGVLKF